MAVEQNVNSSEQEGTQQQGEDDMLQQPVLPMTATGNDDRFVALGNAQQLQTQQRPGSAHSVPHAHSRQDQHQQPAFVQRQQQFFNQPPIQSGDNMQLQPQPQVRQPSPHDQHILMQQAQQKLQGPPQPPPVHQSQHQQMSAPHQQQQQQQSWLQQQGPSPSHSVSGDSAHFPAPQQLQQQQDGHNTNVMGFPGGASGMPQITQQQMQQYMSMMAMHAGLQQQQQQQQQNDSAGYPQDGPPRLGRPPKGGWGAPGRRSAFRGVSWDKSMSAWRCKVNSVHVGYFDIEEEAARAYDEAALALRSSGKNVKLNFPEEDYANKPGFLHYRSKHDGRKRGSSSFRGVLWDKGSRCWRAKIKFQNKTRYLGLFQDERLAAEAYDKAALELRGPSAVLNFPLSDAVHYAGGPTTSPSSSSSAVPSAFKQRLAQAESSQQTQALAAAAAAARMAEAGDDNEEEDDGDDDDGNAYEQQQQQDGASEASVQQQRKMELPQQPRGLPVPSGVVDQSITQRLLAKYNRTQQGADTIRKRLRLEALKKNAPLTASAADAMAMLSAAPMSRRDTAAIPQQQLAMPMPPTAKSNGEPVSGASSPGEPAGDDDAPRRGSSSSSAFDTSAVLALATEVLREQQKHVNDASAASSDPASAKKRKLEEGEPAEDAKRARAEPGTVQHQQGGELSEAVKETIRAELRKMLSEPAFLTQLKTAMT